MIASPGLSRVPVLAALALASACAQTPAAAPSAVSRSILASSTPASGSTVAAPISELALRFDPPARLGEVTVSGAGEMMPMMVTSVGEVADYSLPLSDLGPGNYVVRWRATAAGTVYQGDFSFAVR